MLVKSCLLAALLCLAAAKSIENVNHPGRIPGEYLIVLRQAPFRASRALYVNNVVSKLNGLSAQVLKSYDALSTPILKIKADDVAMTNALSIPEIASIEANVFERKIEQCGSQGSGSTYWGLSRVSSRAAPSYGSATYSYATNGGAGVNVYVLDTGIRTTHTDFGGRARFGANFASINDDDNNGHGTHCAGTVSGTASGVAKATNTVAVKVLTDLGFGSTAGIVDGINWSVGDVGSGRGVLSMSLGGGASSALDSAAESAVSAGLPVVAAAGNSNGNACNGSPSRAPNVITVGSTDNSDSLSSFSDWGTCVNILAPGSDIRSCAISSDTAYVNFSGTSMACPHVAGAVANYLSDNPSATPAQVLSALTSDGSSGFINLRGTTGTPNILLYQNC